MKLSTNESASLCHCHKDCPGGTVHQIKCCDMEDFFYDNCDTFKSDFGESIDCR